MTTDANDSMNNQNNFTSDNPVRTAIFSAHDEKRLAVAGLSDLCSQNGVEIPNTANPVVLITPAIAHQKRRILLRHTSTPAPTETSAPPAGGAMTPMFDSAEHSFIGNDILLNYPPFTTVPASQTPFTLPNGLKLTFGQIVSLGGDFFGDIDSNGDVHEISDGPNPQVFMASFDALATAPGAVQEVPKILAVMQQEITALNHAVTTGQQPSTAYDDLDVDGQYNVATGGGSSVSDKYPFGPYIELASVNWDHFGQNAITAYNAGHAAAIQQAITAKSAAAGTAQTTALNLAYAMDAFACHFLSDLFASGHMRTPRKDLYEDGTPSYAGSYCARYMHNEDNYFGLLVKNNPVHQTVASRSWQAFGDAKLFDTNDYTNLSYVTGAVQQSAREIYGAMINGHAPSYYGALDYVVNLSQFNNVNDTTNSAALFYYQGSTGYCREELSDETNYDWTSVWTALSTVSEIADQDDYADYTPPLNMFVPPTGTITSLTNPYLYSVPNGPWVAGSKVRYAVSFYDQNTGNESNLGPWMNWVAITTGACPLLNGIPICTLFPTGAKVGRRVYRQFMNSAGAITYSQLIATITDNTSTQFQDNSIGIGSFTETAAAAATATD
jgi:hypothetical protein